MVRFDLVGVIGSESETCKLLYGRSERGTTQLDCDLVPLRQSLSVQDLLLLANGTCNLVPSVNSKLGTITT